MWKNQAQTILKAGIPTRHPGQLLRLRKVETALRCMLCGGIAMVKWHIHHYRHRGRIQVIRNHIWISRKACWTHLKATIRFRDGLRPRALLLRAFSPHLRSMCRLCASSTGAGAKVGSSLSRDQRKSSYREAFQERYLYLYTHNQGDPGPGNPAPAFAWCAATTTWTPSAQLRRCCAPQRRLQPMPCCSRPPCPPQQHLQRCRLRR